MCTGNTIPDWREYEEENSQLVIKGSLRSPELAVLDADPDEATSLWDEPEEESDPCSLWLGPPFPVEDFAVDDYHGDSDGC